MKRKCALVLAFIMMMTALPQTVVADSNEKEIIRIGYVEGNPFIGIVNGTWTGYGVEYLEKIAEYTHWEYEYVQIEEKNVEKDLANNDIDFAFITSGRQNQYERLLQSEFFAAYENYVIHARKNDSIYYEDYEALD
jgi:hypothetical protein